MGLTRKLEKLPSVLTENRFNEKGLAETDSGLLVPAYVASELGFNFPGRYFLDNYLYPRLREAGVLPLCPFTSCAEYLGIMPDKDRPLREHEEYWENFVEIIGKVNYETLMPRSKFMIAVMEGDRVDEGVAAETAYFSQHHGPVIGFRTDFRLSENMAAPINGAVRYFMEREEYNGQFFAGPDADKEALKAIKTLAERIKDAA